MITVWARNFRDSPRWVQGVVADRVGPLSYLVRLPDGNLWQRHIDHLREGRELTQSSIHGDDQPQPPDPDSVETGDPPLPLTTEVPVLTPSNGSVVELTSDRSNGNLQLCYHTQPRACMMHACSACAHVQKL